VHKKCELSSGTEWQNGVSAGIFPIYLVLRLIVGPSIPNARNGELSILDSVVFCTAFSKCTSIKTNHGRVAKVGVHAVKPRRIGHRDVDVVAPGHSFADQDLLLLRWIHVSLNLFILK